MQGKFLQDGDIIDSLRKGRNWPELRERLTMLLLVRVRTEAQDLRSQVRVRSESHRLLGQLKMVFEM